MSTGSTALQTPENGNEGLRRLQCPLFGCKRVYAESSALERHVKDHEIPAQSLPGKVLRCSSSGCSSSFSDMQKLMQHMRQHHKPNIYFQCESCRTKLRSYRNLLGHLHTCSKVSRGKPREATAPPPLNAPNPPPMDQAPPQLDSVPPPQQTPVQVSVGSAAPHPGPTDPPVLGPPMLPLQEPQPPLPEAASQPPARTEASSAPPPTIPLTPHTPDIQTQGRAPQALQPAGGAVGSSPTGSAVWKKNQGVVCSRRVLWEHTRGRYTCVQCGHTVTNRKDMNQHIRSQHSSKEGGEEGGKEGSEESSASSS